MTKHDVVWYWKGGVWNPADPNVYPDYKSADQLVMDLERMGYPAVHGKRSIGAPEGPPAEYTVGIGGVRYA